MKDYLKIGLFILSFGMYSCSSSVTTPQEPPSNTDTTAVDSSDTDKGTEPISEWKQDFQGWNSLLTRVYYDKYVAVYYDERVPEIMTWPFKTMSNVWKYAISVYGNFGDENRLYTIYHGSGYSHDVVAHPGTYFDDFDGFRSMIDIPLIGIDSTGWNLGSSVHETSHIVETSSHDVKGSPAFDIWKDSKWAEIYNYDVFKGIGMDKAAKEHFNGYTAGDHTDDFPRPNTHWFRDWFYPIYHNYGESKVLNRFFLLLSKYFPKENHEYTRRMNYGEFIHFWSGAAQKDLQSLAKDAFGWSKGWQLELQRARKRFPELKYEVKSDTLRYDDQTTQAELKVSAENGGGKFDKEGSMKLIDNNDFTKFYLRNYTHEFWAEQLFNKPMTVNAYTITSANDFSDRDPKSWILEGSNDDNNWKLIDKQEGIDFPRRYDKKVFELDSPVNYQYYKLSIKENAGRSDMQMSEWRLLFLK